MFLVKYVSNGIKPLLINSGQVNLVIFFSLNRMSLYLSLSSIFPNLLVIFMDGVSLTLQFNILLEFLYMTSGHITQQKSSNLNKTTISYEVSCLHSQELHYPFRTTSHGTHIPRLYWNGKSPHWWAIFFFATYLIVNDNFKNKLLAISLWSDLVCYDSVISPSLLFLSSTNFSVWDYVCISVTDNRCCIH